MLINRNFAKLWAGQAISVVGDEVFRTTLLLWTGIILLAGKSYAPAVSGAVLIITSVVIVLLGPLAGVYADRWDKKRTMLRMDLIRAVLIGALVVVSIFASKLPLPVILAVIGVVVAAETAAAMFFGPAKVVVIRDVVPEESQGRASGLIQSASSLAGIIGPPLAAPLLVGVSVPVAISVNAMSFVLASTVLLGMDTRVAGVHLGRIDSIFLVAGVVMALSGVYFGLAARKFPDSAQNAGEVVVSE